MRLTQILLFIWYSYGNSIWSTNKNTYCAFLQNKFQQRELRFSLRKVFLVERRNTRLRATITIYWLRYPFCMVHHHTPRRLGDNHYRYNHYQWPLLPYDTHYQWQSLPDDNHYHWQPLPATTTRFYWTRKPLPATTTTWQQLSYDDHWVCIFANFSNKSFKSKTTCIRIYLLVDTWRFIRGGPVL